MTDIKAQRQRAIADLIRTQKLASQEELAAQLARLGNAVTQATISRDLEQIGAVKVRRAGQLVYALPEQVKDVPNGRLTQVLRDWVRSIDSACNLVVIKTPPGSAHLVGVVLDQSEIPEIAGTICGDDTIFVACRGIEEAQALAAKFGTAPSLELE